MQSRSHRWPCPGSWSLMILMGTGPALPQCGSEGGIGLIDVDDRRSPGGQDDTVSGGTEGMVLVPAGEFAMGCDPSDEPEGLRGLFKDTYSYFCAYEYKRVSVYLDAFLIDITEVSNMKFMEFLAKAALTEYIAETGEVFGGGEPWIAGSPSPMYLTFHPIRWAEGEGWTCYDGMENDPVSHVTWYGAKAYCSWRGARLCTSAEWEKAARGADERVFPWGNSSPDCDLAVCHDLLENGSECWPLGGPGEALYLGYAPIDSLLKGASPFGALHMAGNVGEWVSDWYDPEWRAGLRDGVRNPSGPVGSNPDVGRFKVTRGGSAESSSFDLMTFLTERQFVAYGGLQNGFRCCVTDTAPVSRISN